MSRGPLAVIDTNVVVAGLLTVSRHNPTAIILDRMLSGELRFAVSKELLFEYRAVLLRPRVAERHRLAPGGVDAIIAEVARNAIVGSPREADTSSSDPGDQHLWDLLAGLDRAVLVTGDQGALDAATRFEVVTPKGYLDL